MKKFYPFDATDEDISYGDTPSGALVERTDNALDIQIAYPSGEGEKRETISLPFVQFEFGRFSGRLFSIVVPAKVYLDVAVNAVYAAVIELYRVRPELRRRVMIVGRGLVDHVLPELQSLDLKSALDLKSDKHEDCDCMACRSWTS